MLGARLISYFNLYKPSSTSAEGIMEGLSCALKKIGISELHATTCFKLVGFGTDGASANIAQAGLKGLVDRELPRILWMWCLAHRLELAVKDAFKNTAFVAVPVHRILRKEYGSRFQIRKLRNFSFI